MARPGVEYEAVERVARKLLSQGQHPSVQKVREVIGTGSNTTIARHLKAWQISFDASRSPSLPESVPEDLMNPLDEFWSTAVARAEANYQKYKEEIDGKLIAAESVKDDTLTQLTEKTDEVEKLQQALDKAENKLQEMRQQWYTLQGKQSVTTNELTHAHSELERTHALLQAQSKQFKAERDQQIKDHAEALQYERDRANDSENRLLQEVDQLRQEVKTLKTKSDEQQLEYVELQEQRQYRELILQQELSELNSKNQLLKSNYQRCQEDADEINNQITAIQAQLSKSLETVEALRRSLEQSKAKEAKLTENIGELKETILNIKNNP